MKDEAQVTDVRRDGHGMETGGRTPIGVMWCGWPGSNRHFREETRFCIPLWLSPRSLRRLAPRRALWAGLYLHPRLSPVGGCRQVSTPSRLLGLGSGLASSSTEAFSEFDSLLLVRFRASDPTRVWRVCQFRHTRTHLFYSQREANRQAPSEFRVRLGTGWRLFTRLRRDDVVEQRQPEPAARRKAETEILRMAVGGSEQPEDDMRAETWNGRPPDRRYCRED